MLNNTLNGFGRVGLYLTVFLTGASVMVIEAAIGYTDDSPSEK